MTDTELIESVSRITDAREACRVLAEHEHLLGYDPYYADLRSALVDMCRRMGARSPQARRRRRQDE